MSEVPLNGGVECVADTHVHVHACFDAAAAMDAAAAAFDRVASAAAKDRMELLCLTDLAGENTHERLTSETSSGGGWRFSAIDSGPCTVAERGDGRKLHLLPGRQMVSSENLELLALDCVLDVEDRCHSLGELIDKTLDGGGVPVLPWGFGKWAGARGTVVTALMQERSDFLLADNGNRLRGTGLPKLLEEGKRKGFALLAGSDPLPISSQYAQTGSHGVRAILESSDAASPSGAFRSMLRSGEWSAFGPLTPCAVFFINQIRMQIRKRIGGSS